MSSSQADGSEQGGENSDGLASRLRFFGVAALLVVAAAGGTYAYLDASGQIRGDVVDLPQPSDKPPPGATKVLFFGNSHTFVGHVPMRTFEVAQRARRAIWFDTHTAAGVDVRWHLDEGAEDVIADRDWDVVVVQPNSVEAARTPQHFGAALRDFEALAEKHGVGEVIVWVPWARDPDEDVHDIYAQRWTGGNYEEFQKRLSAGVRKHARSAEVCPIGDAWKLVRDRHPKAPLHRPNDGNHATAVGAQLTAYVLYACITGGDPAKVSDEPESVTEQSAAKLRAAASETARKFGVIEFE